MKIAPLMRAYQDAPSIVPMLIHTGQHYDHAMSKAFFDDLGIPRPDINLEVGSGSHARQTADVMVRFEEVCLEHKPDCVLVVGDVNSTIACGMVAAKLGIRLVHVEAGLRSFDRRMPEEINRVLTDSISDLLFVTERSGLENLAREGVASERVHFVGNVMIDTLLANRARAQESDVLSRLGVTGDYGVVTLHRPSNVDTRDSLSRIVEVLAELAEKVPLVWPVHPRTKQRLTSFGLLGELEASPRFVLTAGLGYLDFLKLTSSARLILTDSGGVQEESAVLKVPCVTLRENTERPVTCEVGANRLVGSDPAAIREGCAWALGVKASDIADPELWDGKAATRIVEILSSTT
ncbi:MAG: UDP-N-acetylglucosamine 2-epimerase (non-hydrolyzing) [Myxococcota bacterium]